MFQVKHILSIFWGSICKKLKHIRAIDWNTLCLKKTCMAKLQILQVYFITMTLSHKLRVQLEGGDFVNNVTKSWGRLKMQLVEFTSLWYLYDWKIWSHELKDYRSSGKTGPATQFSKWWAKTQPICKCYDFSFETLYTWKSSFWHSSILIIESLL